MLSREPGSRGCWVRPHLKSPYLHICPGDLSWPAGEGMCGQPCPRPSPCAASLENDLPTSPHHARLWEAALHLLSRGENPRPALPTALTLLQPHILVEALTPGSPRFGPADAPCTARPTHPRGPHPAGHGLCFAPGPSHHSNRSVAGGPSDRPGPAPRSPSPGAAAPCRGHPSASAGPGVHTRAA